MSQPLTPLDETLHCYLWPHLHSHAAHCLQEYVKKLGACLLDGKQEFDGGLNDPVSSNLNKWAAEATSLMVCMVLRNPWAVRAFNAAVDASQLPGRTCAGQWQNSNLLV